MRDTCPLSREVYAYEEKQGDKRKPQGFMHPRLQTSNRPCLR